MVPVVEPERDDDVDTDTLAVLDFDGRFEREANGDRDDVLDALVDLSLVASAVDVLEAVGELESEKTADDERDANTDRVPQDADAECD